MSSVGVQVDTVISENVLSYSATDSVMSLTAHFLEWADLRGFLEPRCDCLALRGFLSMLAWTSAKV